MQRGLAAVAQALHREDVARIEHRGDDAERVAEKPGRGEAQARLHEKRDARERGSEAGEEERARTLAEENPRRERDEDRREVCEQGRIRYRGTLNGGVPESEVAREREAG